MLAGRTIMAMLAVLLQMLAAGNSQATPDSGAILKSARRAQAAFESTRRASLPELSGGSPGGRTEIIGRITLSFESGGDDETVVPEPPRIRSARARLLLTLQEASAALPGDEWIAGQQVRYLIEDSQPQQAARVAEQCRAVRWWCDALMGLVRHVTGDYARADSAFTTALAEMPDEERCRWNDISTLLEGDAAERYRKLDCADRAAFETRWWWLAQPLYSLATNDRRTEHVARVVRARMEEGRRTPHGLLWGDDLREILMRYGSPTWWTRDPPAYLLVQSDPKVTGHYPSGAVQFAPSAHALVDPAGATPEDWNLDPPKTREQYAPAYATSFTYLEHQEALFRRGDSCLVVAAPDLSGDTLFAQRAVSVALALAADEHTIVTARDSGSAAAPRAVVAAAPCQPYLLSLEADAPHERHVARARYARRRPAVRIRIDSRPGRPQAGRVLGGVWGRSGRRRRRGFADAGAPGHGVLASDARARGAAPRRPARVAGRAAGLLGGPASTRHRSRGTRAGTLSDRGGHHATRRHDARGAARDPDRATLGPPGVHAPRLRQQPQHVLPLRRRVPSLVRLRRFVQPIDPAREEFRVLGRSYGLVPDRHVHRARRAERIAIEHGQLGPIGVGAQHVPSAARDRERDRGTRLGAIAREGNRSHDSTVAHDLQVIDGDARAQPHARRERPAAARQPDLVADLAAVERELEQWRVAHERATRLEPREKGPAIEPRAGLHEHPHQAGGPAQRSKVGEGIGSGPGGQPKAAVQQAVPDLRRDETIGVPHHLDVVDLAERHVHRELVGERGGRVARIGLRIEGVDIPEQRSPIRDTRPPRSPT